MTLDNQERNDPLWLKLKADFDSRLAQLRASNDKDMNDTETAKVRGRIAEIRRIIDMGAEKPKIDIE